jgi:hypothetical protein
MIACPVCNAQLGPGDFHHADQSALCPGCGHRVTAPTTARRPAPLPVEEPDDAGPEGFLAARLRHLHPVTVAALVTVSAAVFVASVPVLDVLAKPLSAVGLLLGALAVPVSVWRGRANFLVPAAVSAGGLLALLFLGRWPQAPAPPPPPLVAAPLRPGGMATPQPIQEDDWTDARASAVRRNDLRVQIVSARLGSVEVEYKGNKVVSPDRYLVIRVQVSYEGVVFQQVPYEPWVDLANAPSPHQPTLVDNRERVYPQKAFDADRRVVGRGGRSYLTPGRQVNEVLVFPVPAAGVEYLRLKLPASAFGGEGDFRFQIPRAMIGNL